MCRNVFTNLTIFAVTIAGAMGMLIVGRSMAANPPAFRTAVLADDNPQPQPAPDSTTPAPEPKPGDAKPDDAKPTPKPDGTNPTPAPKPDETKPAPKPDDPKPAPKPDRPAPKPEPTEPEQIIQEQPSFMVRVSVNRPNHVYREGDALSVNVICERDAYAYVLYKQADGKVFQIFPNSIQSDNRIKAKKNVSIPALDDLFRWRISAPFGKEMIKVIASTEPLKSLDSPALHAKRFNTVSKSLVKDVAAKLEQTKPVEWAEDQVEITSYGRDEKCRPINRGDSGCSLAFRI